MLRGTFQQFHDSTDILHDKITLRELIGPRWNCSNRCDSTDHAIFQQSLTSLLHIDNVVMLCLYVRADAISGTRAVVKDCCNLVDELDANIRRDLERAFLCTTITTSIFSPCHFFQGNDFTLQVFVCFFVSI